MTPTATGKSHVWRVVAGAVLRQYQPLGDRSIAPGAFFGQENLERLERRCATLMPSFGYEPSRSREG